MFCLAIEEAASHLEHKSAEQPAIVAEEVLTRERRPKFDVV